MRRDITYKISIRPKFVRAITFTLWNDLGYNLLEKALVDKGFRILNFARMEE
jgi:hypothetical protein